MLMAKNFVIRKHSLRVILPAENPSNIILMFLKELISGKTCGVLMTLLMNASLCLAKSSCSSDLMVGP